jgi:hypothetical protein
LTDRELIGFHAEVKALQERLGISYKDASHRLYMAEVEKLKANETSRKLCVSLKSRTDQALQVFSKYVAKGSGLENVGGQN